MVPVRLVMIVSWVASLIALLLYDDPKVVKRGTGEAIIEKVMQMATCETGCPGC